MTAFKTGVGCFRFRGFAPVGDPNCGGESGGTIVYMEIQRYSSEGVVELPANQILVPK